MRLQIVLEGSLGISGQGTDEDQHRTQYKGGDHENGEVCFKRLPKKMEFHIHGVQVRKPEEEADHNKKEAQ
jgi:hypothetical protein